ncbi:class II fructose-bisphosphatase [Bacteriovoracales bacterium]|nr:class II fructose-bisphosphatase [Bacteriovoracales bacterium]
MNRNLALEFVRVTEMAAIASARFMGRGDEEGAFASSIEAMRCMLDSVECNAIVVIGAGSDIAESSSLRVGETVGSGRGPQLEIALDPLEGVSVCAMGGQNSLSVMAIAEKGSLLPTPSGMYMEKIGTGPEGKMVIDILETPRENLKRLAEVKNCRISDLTAVILERERHLDLIDDVRVAGARIQLIRDGDVAGAISTCVADSGIDILFGTGGATEGVVAASALRCMGGGLQGILKPKNDEQETKARQRGITEFNKVFDIEELASGDVMFCATGVTNGSFLEGVKFKSWGAITHSKVMRSRSGTVRDIRAEHHFDRKPRY